MTTRIPATFKLQGFSSIPCIAYLYPSQSASFAQCGTNSLNKRHLADISIGKSLQSPQVCHDETLNLTHLLIGDF